MMKIQKGREHSHLFGNTRYCTHHMGVTLNERRMERMSAAKSLGAA